MKFTVTGTITIDVAATIEADDKTDAQSKLVAADCCVESCDKDIVFNHCCQASCEVDSTTCDAEEKWDDMNKMERMEMLNGNGASYDASYHVAGGSFDDVPDEWKGYFE